jgi:hypothetical protein
MPIVLFVSISVCAEIDWHCQIKNTIASDRRKSIPLRSAVVGSLSSFEGILLQIQECIAPFITNWAAELALEVFL